MRFSDIFAVPLPETLDHSRRLLFHGTIRTRAAQVLADDRLDAATTDHASVVGHEVAGVSLTRSYTFAMNYHLARRSLVLVLDARHLSTQPVAYWSSKERRDNGRADEMEEYHTGPIAPLSRYLISINASISFEAWFKMISEPYDNPYEKPEKVASLRKAIADGFPRARSLWNRWQPVRGS